MPRPDDAGTRLVGSRITRTPVSGSSRPESSFVRVPNRSRRLSGKTGCTPATTYPLARIADAQRDFQISAATKASAPAMPSGRRSSVGLAPSAVHPTKLRLAWPLASSALEPSGALPPTCHAGRGPSLVYARPQSDRNDLCQAKNPVPQSRHACGGNRMARGRPSARPLQARRMCRRPSTRRLCFQDRLTNSSAGRG